MTTRRVHCCREPYDIYCGRPGPWGNPYIIGLHGDRHSVVDSHKVWISQRPDLVTKIRAELKGKILACWCGENQECHVDTLIQIAEGHLP